MTLTTRRLFSILLFILIFFITLRPIADADFWWHLRTGEWIATTHSIPHTDPFSFTETGKPWVAHEWLSELLMFWIYSLGGTPLLTLIFSGIITAAFFLIYRISPGKPYVAGFSLLLGALATAPVWGVRPQIFSMVFTALFIYILHQYEGNHQLRWILPLPGFMIVWVNMHAGFIIGLAILFIYLLSKILEWGWGSLVIRQKKNLIPEIIPILGVLAGCTLAILLNPNGARMFIYPFETFSSPSMQAYIQEWASPDFHQLIWQPLAWFILALLGFAFFKREKPISLFWGLVSLVFGYLALRSMRNVPLFILAATPLLATLATSASLSISHSPYFRKKVLKWDNRGLVTTINLLIVGLAILSLGGRFLVLKSEQIKTEQTIFPSKAVKWILANHPAGNIYNSYDWGGYLIWSLKNYPVFIDGRADLYGDDFINTYLEIYNAEPGWEDSLSRYQVNLVLIQKNAPLGNFLVQSPHWDLVFQDENTFLFTRR